MISSAFKRLAALHPILLFGTGSGLMVIAGMLMYAHIQTIIQVRDVSVPIVGQLPQMERRLAALTQQIELTELHSATRIGSQQEKVEVYALPEETNVSRVVATFEVIRDVLTRDGLLAEMSNLDISEPVKRDDGSTSRTVSVEFAAHEDGLKTIMLLVQLSGLLTVGDVLTEEEVELLVDRIEQENPSGIVALEQFLTADLLRYAENSKTYEEQLKRSFSSMTFLNLFENVLRTSLLRDVKSLLRSDLGEILSGYKLWPLQLMAIEEVSMKPGDAPKWQRLGLTLLVFSEES
ncbi:MAG: hypothetical protein HOG89_01180 [Candidatus Peribacter sp.]|jgi:hypothetical protein|nr:hypothetical protein [Candidatus Peribacter sp.]MBT4393261.1 hypothetical protein [Candidatus Peribacter sp.]MBT4601156.1 hypothetical protein [Candidatus Peribacter sp.]MBT5148884.1 hypothetical protein [Candidatus Peribacter sp.]MBT5637236.1 hypothetical protein [Candidatus Peribacter sp.]